MKRCQCAYLFVVSLLVWPGMATGAEAVQRSGAAPQTPAGPEAEDRPAAAPQAPPAAAAPGARPTRIWLRTGPLGPTPQRTTDRWPLSDQQNQAGWVRFEPLSDEFEAERLDPGKWVVGLHWWKGRQPALFSPGNVTVADGKLQLTMRREPVPEEFRPLGYHDYTSAAVHSKRRTCYGYYEVMVRPMDSAGSSSFWFQQDAVPGWRTEIDVFEIGGKAPGFERRYNMNLHVFRTPHENEHWSVHGHWEAPWRLADDYHVYGLQWEPDEISYYVDGVVVRRVENTHWHQALYLIFDSETMPQWFGMPRDEDLPSTYAIEYVRAWERADEVGSRDAESRKSSIPNPEIPK